MNTVVDIIEGFGGTSCMARAINLVDASFRPKGREATAEMICNWRVRGRINQDWYPAILDAARSFEVDLTADHLVALNIGRHELDLEAEGAAA